MVVLKYLKPKAAGDQGVAGGEEDLALGSCQFTVSGAHAHLAGKGVRLAVLCRRSKPVE